MALSRHAPLPRDATPRIALLPRRGKAVPGRCRSVTAAAEPLQPPPVLREYQARDAANLLGAVKNAGRVGYTTFARTTQSNVGSALFCAPVRLLYVLPTGGGKTVVLASVMASLAEQGKRCLFLVHRKA